MREFQVYIIHCSDGSFYTGVTNNIELRYAQHAEGFDQNCYTFSRRPLQLVHVEYFPSILDAIAREKQIKRWSRAKKKALICGDESLLQSLSKSYTSRHGSSFDKLRMTGSP